MPKKELAAYEVGLRHAWGLRGRPAVSVIAADADGGDDAKTMRVALEKGGAFFEACRGRAGIEQHPWLCSVLREDGASSPAPQK